MFPKNSIFCGKNMFNTTSSFQNYDIEDFHFLYDIKNYLN